MLKRFVSEDPLGSLATTQSYNGFGELASFSATHGATPLFSYQLDYDKGGRITSRSETAMGGATTVYNYTYDGAGRLASVSENGSVTASWGFDANGNRVQHNGASIASVDAQDRLLTHGATSYVYAAHGALQEKTQGAQTTRYAYDAFGNLKSVELPSGGRIDYLLDERNRRIGKKVNGALVQGFMWQDQLRVVAELDGANSVVARFVYGDQLNVPELMVKGGVTYRIITDHLGSVRLVVDSGTGAIAQRIDYDAWGQVTNDSNPGFQPFGYAGGLYEPSTGLVRFGARDYDAQVGRWTTKDPIRFGGRDANLYAYVKGDPLNRSDPLGLLGRGPGGGKPASGPLRFGGGGAQPSTPGECFYACIVAKTFGGALIGVCIAGIAGAIGGATAAVIAAAQGIEGQMVSGMITVVGCSEICHYTTGPYPDLSIGDIIAP